ncbi:hypothetical protein M5689_005491 [Euphorbia peplus]|nr:hypothetical protein M5689_005491 [Euphorbia peplus]
MVAIVPKRTASRKLKKEKVRVLKSMKKHKKEVVSKPRYAGRLCKRGEDASVSVPDFSGKRKKEEERKEEKQ